MQLGTGRSRRPGTDPDAEARLAALEARLEAQDAWIAEAQPVVAGLIAERAERRRQNELEDRLLAAAMEREAREVADAQNRLLATAADRGAYAAAANGAVTSDAARLRGL